MEDIRLILVDDEEHFRKAVARRLGKRGMVPREAGGGQECLKLLEETPADVIVSDVKMPGMDGLELLRAVRERHPESEIILLTGHAATADGVEGIKSGAFDYLSKPVELDHLMSKIRQAHEKVLRREEKKREAEFRRKMEEQMVITERLASLGTLATGVAHEINNPLAVIKESAGWMALLLKKAEFADMPRKADFEKAVGKIEKSVERARKITHQLLGGVRKNDSVFSETHIGELARESAELLRQEAMANKVTMLVEDAPTVKSVWSDPHQLRQILINLMTNAIHASRPEGQVRVRVRFPDGNAEIEVADQGEGIPREHLRKIFEPFFSTKSPGKGTGLGLFVTRSIVEKLGGHIEVESQVGQGTSFRVTLPCGK